MNYINTMKELPKEERPYEKCTHYGANSLTNVELLAILLRTGTKGVTALELARSILNPLHMNSNILNIHHWNREQLLKVNGIGGVKAVQILCISELTKRLSKATAHQGLSFTNPSSIADYYMEDLRHQKQEQLKLLLLNTKAKLIGETDISKGTVNASLISPRELFLEALNKNAVSIILLHNHPSGDPAPSKEDILITKRVIEAGNLIGIELLDHIIIGNNSYTSMRESRLI